MKKKINLISPRLKNITVAVIGDLIYDKYIWGEANRISPEAPVPVILAKNESESLGGAGNVIANLAGLNVNTIIKHITTHTISFLFLNTLFIFSFNNYLEKN